MKQEIFNIIKTNLEDRVNACKAHLDNIKSTEDLANLTIKEFIELRSFAKKEQVDMTEIVMVDLYHVLGMGELTVSQRNVFLQLINKYMSYRSDIKMLAMTDSIEKLPKLPSCSSFKLHKLGNITLISKLRGRNETGAEPIEESAKIKDYGETKYADLTSTIELKSIEVQGNVIKFNREDIDDVLAVINPNANKDKLFKAAEGKISYCDIVWEYVDGEHQQLRGIFMSTSKRDSVRDKLKNKGIIR